MKTIDYYRKLADIQAKLKAPKTLFNAFGKYKYRSCESILEAVKPLLDGVPLTITDNIVMLGDRYYVKSTASFGPISVSAFAREDADKKGMDAAQLTGATSSYCRKYALNGLFCIDDTKDVDGINIGGGDVESHASHLNEHHVKEITDVFPQAKVVDKKPVMTVDGRAPQSSTFAPEFITPGQLKEMQNIISDKGVDMPKFLAYLGVKRLPDIKQEDVKKAMNALAAKKVKKDADNN